MKQKARTPVRGVTGRDNYIIAQALTYAILVIDALPPERRSLSNQMDMKAILDHLIEDDLDLARMSNEVRLIMSGR